MAPAHRRTQHQSFLNVLTVGEPERLMENGSMFVDVVVRWFLQNRNCWSA
jgi:hypothetical protein